MKNAELWKSLTSERIDTFHGFRKEFVVIPKETFVAHQEHFRKSRNMFTSHRSFRSKQLVRHVHAIDRGNVVVVHRDHGNLDRFKLLGILHLVGDVVPYALWSAVRRTQKKKLKQYLLYLEKNDVVRKRGS